MLNPEIADALVVVGQGEAVVGFGMTEAGRIKVNAESLFARPIHPVLEMFELKGVPLHLDASCFRIHGVQVEAVFPRNKAQFP